MKQLWFCNLHFVYSGQLLLLLGLENNFQSEIIVLMLSDCNSSQSKHGGNWFPVNVELETDLKKWRKKGIWGG